jgi:DNA (cytosine-5)-methyltransferase 1
VARKQKTYKVASLFCGCGGLDLGLKGGFELPYGDKVFKEGGYEIVWANDFDKNATITYQKYFGNHVVHGDIVEIIKDVKLSIKNEEKLLPHGFPKPETVDIVTGGFPCQPFSLAGKRKGLADKRGKLYLAMCDAISVLKPKAFIAENVRGLMSMKDGDTLEMIVSDLKAIGYNVSSQLYKAFEWGVPQTRERVIIIGIRNDIAPFSHPKPSISKNLVTLSDAIGDLAEKSEEREFCHVWSKAKKNKGQGNITCKADKPGPTMRAEHHGNIEFHYSLKRRLSAREAARIQSFPDDMNFYPSVSAAYKQIGNAVPPILGWHVGQALKRHLDKHA